MKRVNILCFPLQTVSIVLSVNPTSSYVLPGVFLEGEEST